MTLEVHLFKTFLKIALFGTVFWAFSGCEETGSGLGTVEKIPCQDPAKLLLPRFSITSHKIRDTILTKHIDSIPGIRQWARGDSVMAFMGGKDFKLVFTLNKAMYLVTYVAGEPTLKLISQDDEGANRKQGSINSPLFSPDGDKIVFAGNTDGKPSFVMKIKSGSESAYRWRVDANPNRRVHVTSDPHWHVEGGKTWIYFSTVSGLVFYNRDCRQLSGSTYRAEWLDDTAVGPIETSGIKGAYRGGLSKDGKWAGTSYSTAAIFDLERDSTVVIGDSVQQCNSSMNPYPIGSKHNDYMMTLAFGGEPAYHSIDGQDLLEGLHENLWIYNKDGKIVWQAKRPDEKFYYRWDKPEWSTHPNFATAVASHDMGSASDLGDLYIVKIGDLANAEEGKLNQAEGYMKIASHGLTGESFSHLWVAP